VKDCEKYAELISALFDGEITPEEQALLEEHLGHCPQCGKYAEEVKALHEAMADMEEEAPRDLEKRVTEAIHAEKRKKSPWRKIIPIGLAGAAVVALAVGTLGNISPDRAVTTDSVAVEESAECGEAEESYDSQAAFPVTQGSGEDSDSVSEAESYASDDTEEGAPQLPFDEKFSAIGVSRTGIEDLPESYERISGADGETYVLCPRGMNSAKSLWHII
jgi:anti-sigma factor RsiW